VVELMPRDAGHIPVLPVGPKLALWGRWFTTQATLGWRSIRSLGFASKADPATQAARSSGVPPEEAPVTQEKSVSPRPVN
jgi:hypothetical protein